MLVPYKIALSAGMPSLISQDVYSSQCCCANPCYTWKKATPQTAWPCCGLAQMYSVSGGRFEDRIIGRLYRLSGSINVTAVPDFPGLWSGSGGTFEAGEYFFPGQPFFQLGTGIAEIRGPFPRISAGENYDCYWVVSLGYQDASAGLLGLVTRFKEYVPRSLAGPNGSYDPERAGLIGSITVS
jgi:hypothetical protein